MNEITYRIDLQDYQEGWCYDIYEVRYERNSKNGKPIFIEKCIIEESGGLKHNAFLLGRKSAIEHAMNALEIYIEGNF